MKWLRLWTEWAQDPKITTMPEPMQRRHIVLLCLRRIVDTSTLSDEEIASYMRISIEDLQETKELFTRKRFIDNGWNVLAWDFRNPPSDSSADRTRKYRERLKKKESDKDETSQERHGDAIEKIREEEIRIEKDIKHSCPSSTAVEVAQLLKDLLLKEQPGAKVPNNKKMVEGKNAWANIIERMIRIDKRDPAQIEKMIRWLFSENVDAEASFVVKSAQSLREKFDKIETQMGRGNGWMKKYLT